ncbi:Beta-1,3-glucan-binding protein [Trachymyrmex septentrionalis]|uniref:Beta-1,3-glucan-binding protein n=2 Tax=Trachymyrmex septentrionalis TaxID=34720 RepID=A0A195FII1_9HYME|nr:Beta-1,3-glucan-binding protein [Trachymyrmex septentrionalis]
MLSCRVDRAIVQLIFALACILVKPVFPYVLPDPIFEVLKPQGLRVSIPDAPGLRIFGFHANINKAIRTNEYGQIAGDTYLATDGRWIFEDSDVTIKNGDVLHYWIYVQTNGINHRKNDQRWTYSQNEVDNQETTQTNSSKYEIPTEGRLLLEDYFNSFNASLWKREIKMPLDPDYEFCVYHNQNHKQLVQVQDGQLFIRPIILEDYYGENATAYGRLQLNECTSLVAFECTRQALSYSILPPVISARFTTKERFVLQYGKIEIRAKFPEGDWLYPEMWLEPRYSTYGMNYASGRVLLGLTRGNENLVNATNVSKIYDTRRLDFGVRVSPSLNEIQEILVTKVNEFGPRWTKDFHVYTTIWTSDGFTFLVDGEEVGRISPNEEGWTSGPHADRKAAPFDQEFFITLGVGVGGVRVFPDGTHSSGMRKPWRNIDAKIMTLKKVTVILIIFVWATDSLVVYYPRSRRSSNEYILHRCTATAELIRKHRNEDVGASLRRAEGNLAQSQTQQKGSLIDAIQSETSKQISNGVFRRMTHMRRRGSGHARRIAGKHLADTPLKTVNINVPQDRPSTFKKKNPLPELSRNISGRNINSSPHVIIIKSVT